MSSQNAWAALRAANEKVGQFSESQILVEMSGIEPESEKTLIKMFSLE
jgi:hypothetical protein